eukprot:g32430.t2
MFVEVSTPATDPFSAPPVSLKPSDEANPFASEAPAVSMPATDPFSAPPVGMPAMDPFPAPPVTQKPSDGAKPEADQPKEKKEAEEYGIIEALQAALAASQEEARQAKVAAQEAQKTLELRLAQFEAELAQVRAAQQMAEQRAEQAERAEREAKEANEAQKAENSVSQVSSGDISEALVKPRNLRKRVLPNAARQTIIDLLVHMQKCQDDVDVCSKVCEALESLTFEEVENTLTVIQHRGVEEILAMLQRHKERRCYTTCKSEQLRQEKDPMLLRPAMDALWNLTFHEQAVDRATEQHAVETVAKVMAQHLSCALLQTGCCAVLLNLAVVEQNRSSILEEGGSGSTGGRGAPHGVRRGCGDQLPVPLYDGISPGVEAPSDCLQRQGSR